MSIDLSMSKHHFLEQVISNIYKEKGCSELIKLLISKIDDIKYGIIDKYFYIEGDTQKTSCLNRIYVMLIIKFLRKQYLIKKLKNWLYRLVKNKTIDLVNDKDLLQEPLLNPNDYIEIKCYHKIFRFTETDLKNIVTNDLENTMMDSIPDPISPRNPYLSGYYFNHYQLDLIYKFLEKKNKLTDTIILFKIVGFNFERFLDNNQEFLRRRIVFNQYKNISYRAIIIQFYQLLRFLKINVTQTNSNFWSTFLNRNKLLNYQKIYFIHNKNSFVKLLRDYTYLISYISSDSEYLYDNIDSFCEYSELRKSTITVAKQYEDYCKKTRPSCYISQYDKNGVFIFKATSNRKKNKYHKMQKLYLSYAFTFNKVLTFDTTEETSLIEISKVNNKLMNYQKESSIIDFKDTQKDIQYYHKIYGELKQNDLPYPKIIDIVIVDNIDLKKIIPINKTQD